ncbi:hypothetical protein BLOT_007972 [Blomia tropicalis]|nr:hypothetical protein BLOT_007972 [Blomia tropicalis]
MQKTPNIELKHSIRTEPKWNVLSFSDKKQSILNYEFRIIPPPFGITDLLKMILIISSFIMARVKCRFFILVDRSSLAASLALIKIVSRQCSIITVHKSTARCDIFRYRECRRRYRRTRDRRIHLPRIIRRRLRRGCGCV